MTWHELAQSAARADEFAAIESYGLIGDGESVALVARDGCIDWWAAPAMDSPPVFAAILDPAGGGRFALEPAVPYEVTRRYLPGTNVLETTFSTGDGKVRVIDSLNQGANGPLPWAELARDIRPDSGEVPMRWRVTGGTLFHRVRPWARVRDVPLLHAGDLMVALVAEQAGRPKLGLGEFSGEFTAKAGQNALLTLIAADHAPLVVPSAAEVRTRREASEQAWRKWCKTVPYRGEDHDLVLRSVLALKLLTYAPTGAMAAAATSSLPERIGGDRNYDYRYGWIRDTSFVLDSFIQLGLTQEVQGTLAWMLSCISASAPEIHPFYGLRGYAPDSETELRLRGYRDSHPARDGNRAVGQPQWGCYGDLLECVWLAVDRAGAHLDPASADLLDELGNRVCDIWTKPDCGIWELDERRHNTFSKAGCWVALDRLIRLAKVGQVSDRDVDRWKAERAAIREWINQHCWSEAKQSYVGHAGSDELDASLLLLARAGFVGGRDRRFGQTIRAIRAELTAEGPLLYRFNGARDFEGAFVACSFWLIDALVRNGHAEEARKLWTDLTGYASDLGLFAEEIDPATGAFLGNMPQGLSHLALLNAAALLASA
ncbi:MAG TPA: glycoside hydrolase family 15 protein [Streptosporangiaceae bacterium]|nr:glycoside hydrolase family 15 protein [Streptosporangiaceae bacterium]